MRWNLLKTFDKIFIIDLHGSLKKKSIEPNLTNDENVFDIMQGVSINLFIKTNNKKKSDLSEVLHHDLFGKRIFKYEFLLNSNFKNVKYKKIQIASPYFLFVPRNYDLLSKYNKGFSITSVFPEYSLGLLTKKDKFITDFEKKAIQKRLKDFQNEVYTDIFLSKQYDLKLMDKDKWNLSEARQNLIHDGINDELFRIFNYRCFDKRFIYYQSDFVARLNTRILRNFKHDSDIALITTRQLAVNDFTHIFITNIISDQCFISNRTKEGCNVFPIYVYPTSDLNNETLIQSKRTPNLKKEIVEQIASGLSLTFTNEKEKTKNTFAPIDILDYIYAVLHSPTYREKYKEFLKIDFPRVPYPTNQDKFWQLVKFGSELREIHLLESATVNKFITSYPEHGTNTVEKIKFEKSKVWINDKQYFDKVPQIAWEFYIGGYQPAQKWLKDRRGRELSFDDIQHYQKIIVALTETNRIMNEIDKIGIE